MQSSSHGNSSALVDELMRLPDARVGEDGRRSPGPGSPPGSVDVYAD